MNVDDRCKSMDWFLYDRNLRHERVNNKSNGCIQDSVSKFHKKLHLRCLTWVLIALPKVLTILRKQFSCCVLQHQHAIAFKHCNNLEESQILACKMFDLTLLWRTFRSYKNQSIVLQSKSVEWFLNESDLRHERVNGLSLWNKLQNSADLNVF